MKILLSSQDFWFWPTTQMFSFIKHLLINWFKWELFLKENKTTELFYKKFIEKNNYKNISLVNNYIWEYEKYIWFYDQEIIFEWKRQWKKTIFLCNLTFLWNISLIEKYKNWFNFNGIDFNKIKNHHELILLWYLVADLIFIRNTDWIDKRSIFFDLIKEKTTFIWPIIYPKIYKRKEKDFILVQFWWQVNPITSDDFYINYFKLVKKILENVDINKKIIINPLLEKQAKKIFKKEEIITTLSQEDYQKLLSETKALFSPFWINTFFESSYYNIPTFILPEQHIWHIKSIFQYFSNIQNIKKNSYLFYELDKYPLNCSNEIDFINFLNISYKKLLEKKIDIDLTIFLNQWDNLINKFWIDKNINFNLNIFLNEVL